MCNLTIAIPVYERYEYFEGCVQSAIKQSSVCKVIIVDNCSSNNKFKDHVNLLNNKNITYYRNSENVGMVENWNYCIKLCETEWITILHDDDLLHPKFVEYFMFLISNAKFQIDAICFQSEIGEKQCFNSKKKLIRGLTRVSPKMFLLGNITPFPGVVFKPKNNGIYFKEEEYPIADIYFWYEMAQISSNFYKNKTSLAFYRFSTSQTSSLVYESIIKKTYQFIKKNVMSKWNPIEWVILIRTVVMLKNYYKRIYVNNNIPSNSVTLKMLNVLANGYIKLFFTKKMKDYK